MVAPLPFFDFFYYHFVNTHSMICGEVVHPGLEKPAPFIDRIFPAAVLKRSAAEIEVNFLCQLCMRFSTNKCKIC